MKLLFAIRNRTLRVCVGAGEQTLKWACVAACQRYCVAEGLFPDELEPMLLLREESNEPLNPWMRINVSKLEDGARLRLLVTGDDVQLRVVDADQREACAVLRPYDFEDVRGFGAALSLILMSKEHSSSIFWSKSLRSLVIADKVAFARNVMPHFFPHQNIEIFAANLARAGFVASFPPPGHELEPRFASERRLEFVHSFAQPEVSPTARDEVVKAAVAHFKMLLNRTASQASLAAKRSQRAREAIEADDRPLQAFLQVMRDGNKFEELFSGRLGLSKMLPSESFFEDLAVSRQLLLRDVPVLLALFRSALASHAAVPLFLSSGDFVSTLKEIGAIEEPSDTKDAEMSFLEANVASSSAGNTTGRATTAGGGGGGVQDTVRQMVFDEFIGAVFRYAHRKFAPNAWPLAREAEELFAKHIRPSGERLHVADVDALGWLKVVTACEPVHRAIVELSSATRDAYYSAAAPDAWLSFDKLRVALAKSRLATFETANYAVFTKRAFVLASAVSEPAPASNSRSSGGSIQAPVTHDAFRGTLLLMCRFMSQTLARPGMRQPPAHLVPLFTALTAAAAADYDKPEFDANLAAAAIRAFLEATIDDITTKKPAGRGKRR